MVPESHIPENVNMTSYNMPDSAETIIASNFLGNNMNLYKMNETEKDDLRNFLIKAISCSMDKARKFRSNNCFNMIIHTPHMYACCNKNSQLKKIHIHNVKYIYQDAVKLFTFLDILKHKKEI